MVLRAPLPSARARGLPTSASRRRNVAASAGSSLVRKQPVSFGVVAFGLAVLIALLGSLTAAWQNRGP